MFKKLKLTLNTCMPYSIYKTFVTKEAYIAYLTPLLSRTLEVNHKMVGILLGIHDLQVVKAPALDAVHMHHVCLSTIVDAYVASIAVNEHVLAIVEHIDESCNLLVDTGFYKVQVHHSQINNNCLYNYHKNQIQFNKKSIKVGDILKVKVLEKYMVDNAVLKIRGTIKGATLGKKAWFS